MEKEEFASVECELLLEKDTLSKDTIGDNVPAFDDADDASTVGVKNEWLEVKHGSKKGK